MSSDNPSSSNINQSNNNEAAFETSFADDVNGAAFKSLLKNSSNNATSSSSIDQSNVNPLHLDPLSEDTAVASSTSGGDGKNEGSDQPPEDLNLFISDLLEQMQSKFENMGNTILGRIDDMGSRIDTLEKSIGDLMDQSGLSEPSYGSSGDIIKKNDKSDD